MVVAVICAAPHTAHALELTDVLAALARVERSNATFEETRYIAALAAPLVRQGTLRYVRPARLEMNVEKPFPERIVIAGDSLTMESRNGKKMIRLSDIPAAAAWVESVRATLAGDGVVLQRFFTVRTAGDLPQWTLELTPLEPDLAAIVARITIGGERAKLSRIEINERGGDRSVMLITSASATR